MPSRRSGAFGPVAFPHRWRKPLDHHLRRHGFVGDTSLVSTILRGAFRSRIFRIGAYTLGYSRAIGTPLRVIQTALGADVTLYSVPGEINPYYGDRPRAWTFIFVSVSSNHTDAVRHQPALPPSHAANLLHHGCGRRMPSINACPITIASAQIVHSK
jgi:hypothetical protein